MSQTATVDTEQMIADLPAEVQDRVFDIKDATRDETVADILADLADWQTEFTGEQLAGIRAAMDIIRENYPKTR